MSSTPKTVRLDSANSSEVSYQFHLQGLLNCRAFGVHHHVCKDLRALPQVPSGLNCMTVPLSSNCTLGAGAGIVETHHTKSVWIMPTMTVSDCIMLARL